MILKDVDNSIVNQYQRLFAQDKVEIIFSDEFLEDIADLAILKDLGARGLRQILEIKMKPIFFEIQKYIGKKIKLLKEKVEVLSNEEQVKMVKKRKNSST